MGLAGEEWGGRGGWRGGGDVVEEKNNSEFVIYLIMANYEFPLEEMGGRHRVELWGKRERERELILLGFIF